MRPALVLALLALLAVVAVARTGPPAPKPDDAPAIEFSAGRAELVIANLVGDAAPHPVGTAAHDRIRELLADRLGGLGFEVQRLSRFVCSGTTCANVTDLLARLPGRVGANAVVLTAHYDSVPAGPGASDDGMGVATVLEVARALRAAPSLRRPVWFLLTDGEEIGLFGAKALVESPLVGQIGVVVNVEARGTKGPSLMFETSARNAGLVRVFAASTAHPIASSLFPTLYSILPNDTDLSVYKGAGLAGLNYAIIGGAARYHTPRDDLAHADPGSLQHHGDNALAVVRALADGASSSSADDDLVFFDVLGAFVVRWPARVSFVAALAVLAALGASAFAAFKRGLLSGTRLAFGAASALAVPAAAAIGVVAGATFGVLGAAPAAWVAHPWPMELASSALGAMAAAWVVGLMGRRADAEGMWWGPGLVLAALSALVSARLPGLSFFFEVPAAAACLATGAWTFGSRKSSTRRGWLSVAMPVTTVLVWVPTLGLLYDGLGSHLLAGVAAGTGLVVWTAAPVLVSLSRRAQNLLLAGLALVSVFGLVAARVVAPFDADTPAHVSIRFYQADGEAPRALLFAHDGAPDALARAFPAHEHGWPWLHESVTASAAASAEAAEPLPRLEVVSLAGALAERRISVRLRSARGASIVGIALRPGDFTAVSMHGEPLAAPEPVLHRAAPWSSYECVTTPAEGIDVELTAVGGQPVVAYVYDRAPGLPPGAPRNLADMRGPDAVPYGPGDYSVVAKEVTF
jgi:hypothetical protein